MGVTAELSQFVSGLTIDTTPTDVVCRARQLLLDLIGNIIRGHETESTAAVLAAIAALGLESGASRGLR